MIRIVLGYIVAIFFGLGTLGGVAKFFDLVSEQKPYTETQIQILLCLIILILWIFLKNTGEKSRNEIFRIQEYALEKQNEFGFVNTIEVAEKTGSNMVTVTNILKDLENKKFIMIDVGNTSDKRVYFEGNKSNQNQSINGIKYNIKKNSLDYLLEENLITEEYYNSKCQEICIHFSDNLTGPDNNEFYDNGKSENVGYISLGEKDSKLLPA